MLLEEYDEAFHISNEKEISYQDGFADGVKEQKQQTEQEKERADRAEQRAECAEQRAECAEQKNKILTLRLQKYSDEEIAAALHIPIEQVRESSEII